MFSVHITHQAEQDKAIQMEPWFGDAEPSVTVTQSKVIGMSWDVEQRVDASSLSSFSAHPGSSVPVWKCGLCLNSIVGSQTLSKVPGAAVVHGSPAGMVQSLAEVMGGQKDRRNRRKKAFLVR